jgi:hypothetical protein
MSKLVLVFATSLLGLATYCSCAPVFAVDSSGPTAATACPPGYIQTARGCLHRDMVEPAPAGSGWTAHPLCDQDSDCPNGQVCQSCNSVRDVFNEQQCPSDKSFCSSAEQ